MDFSCFQARLAHTSCLFVERNDKKFQPVHYYSYKRYITDKASGITIMAKTDQPLSANDHYPRIIVLNNA